MKLFKSMALLFLLCVPTLSFASGGNIAVIVPMFSMGGHSFDGARLIEEYADRAARSDALKRTKIILTLQARFFLEKALEKLSSDEAAHYAVLLDTIGEQPLDWQKMARIPDYAPQSSLGKSMIALLKKMEYLSSVKDEKELYVDIRDFAYSMGYVRLFDRYFDFPGDPVFTKEVKEILPADSVARGVKEKQLKLDDDMWRSYWSISGMFLAFAFLLVVLPIAMNKIRALNRMRPA